MRSWWRHEQLSIVAAVATALHHSAGPVSYKAHVDRRQPRRRRRWRTRPTACHGTRRLPTGGCGQVSFWNLGSRGVTAPCGTLRGLLHRLRWPVLAAEEEERRREDEEQDWHLQLARATQLAQLLLAEKSVPSVAPSSSRPKRRKWKKRRNKKLLRSSSVRGARTRCPHVEICYFFAPSFWQFPVQGPGVA